MPEAPIAKVCTRCSTDVGGKPRVKDAKGRYMCRPCFDALAARRSPSRPGKGSDEPVRIAGIHADADPEPAPADENAMVFDLAPVAGAPAKGGGPCPGCGHFLAAGVRICVNCGFNTATGAAITTAVGVEKVKGGAKKGFERDPHLEAESRDQHRNAYRNAIGTLVAGIIGMVAAIAAMTDEPELYVPFYMLSLLLSIAGSFVAFLLFALCGAAGGAGFLLILLEVSAVCAGFMPFFLLTAFVPGRRVRWGIRALVLGGLATWLLDMEPPNNYVFAGVVFAIMIGSLFGAAAIMGASVG